MKCPNCNKKFFYLFKVDHSRYNNLRRGFGCPYCQSTLKIRGVKKNAFVSLTLFACVYFLINLEKFQDILNQNFFLAGISCLIPVLLGFFGIFYFIEYSVLLKVEEKKDQLKEVEKEKSNQKGERGAKKIGSSFLFYAVITAGVSIYKNSLELFVLSVPPLLVLGDWVWFNKGRKGSLVMGLLLALLTAGVCMWLLIAYL